MVWMPSIPSSYLDDRRLGLPSDFILYHPPPPPSAFASASTLLVVPHHSHCFSSSSSFSDAFFQHLSLLKQSRRLSEQLLLNVPLQPIRQPVRSAHSLYQMHIRGKDPNFNGFGAQLHHHHHHQQLLKPAQIQFTSSAESRKGVLRREHQETIFPSQFGSKGGFDKVCGGTGVFHPKVLNSSTTSTTTTVLEANRMRIQGLRSNELEDWT